MRLAFGVWRSAFGVRRFVLVLVLVLVLENGVAGYFGEVCGMSIWEITLIQKLR